MVYHEIRPLHSPKHTKWKDNSATRPHGHESPKLWVLWTPSTTSEVQTQINTEIDPWIRKTAWSQCVDFFWKSAQKLDGNYHADFICRNFKNMLQNGRKCSKLFVQDNCPILNCAKVRKALKEVGGELFPIPKWSGDLYPIKNIFNIAKEDLKTQAIRLNLTWKFWGLCKKNEKYIVFNVKGNNWQYHRFNV